MLKPPYNLTITGTIRKNKREIPAEMKVADKKPPHTKFCFSPDVTLVSYTPRRNRIVLVASTRLRTTEMTRDKSNIILHYNQTKGGTDCFDKLCKSFTVSRKTNRWPMRVFSGMLDQTAVNARILLACKRRNEQNNPVETNKNPVTASYCLEKIYLYLVTPHLQERYTTLTIRRYLRTAIGGILNIDTTRVQINEPYHLVMKCRCSLCPRAKDRKAVNGCAACHRAMCNDHRSFLCIDCMGLE